MMYHLHIADKQLSSWSLRAWILLRQANIPFIETVHSYHADLLAQRQQWRSFSPTSKVPVLLDGETLVWESLAIADYVAEDYPQLWPANRVARAWARSATAEMHAGFAALRTACNFRLDETDAPVIDDDLRADLFRLNELWQEAYAVLVGHSWRVPILVWWMRFMCQWRCVCNHINCSMAWRVWRAIMPNACWLCRHCSSGGKKRWHTLLQRGTFNAAARRILAWLSFIPLLDMEILIYLLVKLLQVEDIFASPAATLKSVSQCLLGANKIKSDESGSGRFAIYARCVVCRC